MSGIRKGGMRPKLSSRVKEKRKKFDETQESIQRREKARMGIAAPVKEKAHEQD